ncbi:hypothetical protein C882_2509 [Caenispirillum salinarum AK4]|uniref:histidine kinase n=1 Tax=Caenispirillum salinarum AK4 TaxID=1238182 RepID=K9H2D0_9PROT|nr:ATP-binding protein [Caenispirillum salinarum]EKV32430.1 hypothetical protein C882_2509 [Caenispirillum salinarum AK4]
MVSAPPKAVQLVTRLVRLVLLIVVVWAVAMVSLWLLADRARTETATAASRDLFATVVQTEQKRLLQVARDYAWWDDSIRKVLIDLDPDWADNNLGGYLQEGFDIGYSVVLRGDGVALYGAVDGARMDIPTPSALGQGSLALLEAARAAPRAPKPVGAAGIIQLDGRPALAAAMPFVPEEADSPAPPDPDSVLLVARVLDSPWLADLGEAFNLRDLRLVAAAEAEDHAAGSVLETLRGAPLAAAVWQPVVPGDRMDGIVLAVMAALSLAMLGLLAVFLRRARRLAHRVAADDAERLAQAEALAASRSRLRHVIAAAPVALVVADADGTVMLADGREAPAIAPPDGTGPLGRPLREAYGHLPGFADLFDAALAGAPTTATVWHGRRAFEVACAPVSQGAGPRGGGVVAVLTDITERKAAEDVLRRTLDELTRSNSELERFAYIASHDLQEPVRTMVAYAQLTRRRYADQVDEDGRAFLDFIETGALRMRALVQGLLSYSRLNGTPPATSICPAGEALDMALENLADAIREAGATVEAEAVLPHVAVDRLELTQVFQNLIGNALKFRDHGRSPRIEVSARPARSGGHWTITVRDNGIGIASEYQEEVFILFKRLHAPDAAEGTGVGLAICQRVVERHGGRIWVTSQAGDGSAFHFTLPAAADAEPGGAPDPGAAVETAHDAPMPEKSARV